MSLHLTRILVVLVLAVCGSAFAQPLTNGEIRQGFRERALIAKLRGDAVPTEVETAELREGMHASARFQHLPRLRMLELPSGESVAHAIERLRATGRYEFVEPDYILRADATPSDPHFLAGDQWSLRNVGQSSGKAGADIHAEDAWDIQSNASNVVVAIIDSGIRPTHEDLAANLWRNPGESIGAFSSNLTDDDGNGYIDDVYGINAILGKNAAGDGLPLDDAGHGTAVASVIGAGGNNGLGMTGVAWSTQLMALKFLDMTGFGLVSDQIACLDYAIAQHAQIVNCSFGFAFFSQAQFDAFKRARDAGIIIVCSAGNNATNNDLVGHYPSSYLLDNIVAVANTTRNDDLSVSSDFGSGTVDLGAPGTSIFVANHLGDHSYTTLSGTSFSAPMVTGALALLKAKFPNDTYRETINRLLRSVDPLPSLAGKASTGGRLNLAAALRTTSTRPFNDDFAARAVLVGESLTARGAAQFSTREAAEPVHAGVAGSGSLWWTWVAPRSGPVTIDTSGSGFDTLLGVYTGSGLGALTVVASNDDESASISTSKVSFTATAGTAYQIAVDGKAGIPGLVVLHLNLFASNDAFVLAQDIAGLSWSVHADNRQATHESSEPLIKNRAGSHSVWYRWVAPATRRYYIGVFSRDFDPLLGVYTGTSLSTLTEVASSLPGGGRSPLFNTASVAITANAGTTYYILVDSDPFLNVRVAAGTFTLSCTESEWEFFGFGKPGTVAVAPDNTLNFADDSGGLYALNPDGSRKWRIQLTGFNTYSDPAIAADGTIYVGDKLNYVHAVNPDGSHKWYVITNGVVESSPAIADDGTVYVRSDDGKLYALNPDNGTTKWTFSVGTSSTTTYSSPSIAPNGTIYCAGPDSKLYALNPDGTLKWSYASGFIYASPSLAADGTIYFGVTSPGSKLIALKPDGTLKWSFPTGDTITSSAAIGPDGSVYFGSADKNIYSLTATGQLRWTCAVGDSILNSSPVIASDGSVFVGCADGQVYCVGADGTIRRTYATGDQVLASPVLNNSHLYIPSRDGCLYSIDVGQVAATSPWPMHRQNLRHIGRAIGQTLAIGVPPKPTTILDGSSGTFTVGAVGTGALTYQWRFNGNSISGATGQSYTVDGATMASAGQYSVVITDSSGSITSLPVALTVTPVAPVIVTQPVGQMAVAGDPVTLIAIAGGTAPFTYQWSRNGSAIPGATNATFTLPSAQATDAGNYTVTVTNSAGTTTSQTTTLTVNSIRTGHLVNLSILTSLASGDSFTVGTVLGGAGTTGDKPILVRAVGPTLGAAPFNVPGVLADPRLDLFLGPTKVATNDNWGGATVLIAAAAQVGAFPFSDATSRDAAVAYSANVATPPFGFTVQIGSNAGYSGLVLAEIYDSTPAQQFTTKTPRLINVSVLKPIGTGLTAGFVVSGTTSIKVLIRAIGPSLGTLFGVAGAIADPKLELFDDASKSIATNDNWNGTTTLSAAFTQIGAFALDPASKDSALLAILKPGNYTVQVTPGTGASGVALVEIYEIP